MAQVGFINLGSLHAIAPGETQHRWWNNAPDMTVWAVSVDAYVATDVPVIPPPSAVAKVEVAKVEHHRKHGTGEGEIHYWVKNNGSVKAYYIVHMALITP